MFTVSAPTPHLMPHHAPFAAAWASTKHNNQLIINTLTPHNPPKNNEKHTTHKWGIARHIATHMQSMGKTALCSLSRSPIGRRWCSSPTASTWACNMGSPATASIKKALQYIPIYIRYISHHAPFLAVWSIYKTQQSIDNQYAKASQIPKTIKKHTTQMGHSAAVGVPHQRPAHGPVTWGRPLPPVLKKLYSIYQSIFTTFPITPYS